MIELFKRNGTLVGVFLSDDDDSGTVIFIMDLKVIVIREEDMELIME